MWRSSSATTRNHRAVMRARARETRGQGTADARVDLSLVQEGETTKGTMQADVQLAGRAAAMGRGVIQDVSAKIVTTFSENLERMLGGGEPEAEPAPEPQAAAPEAASAEAEAPATGAEAGGGPEAAAATAPPPPGTAAAPPPPPPAAASAAGGGECAAGRPNRRIGARRSAEGPEGARRDRRIRGCRSCRSPAPEPIA
jgi:hypothetical protein